MMCVCRNHFRYCAACFAITNVAPEDTNPAPGKSISKAAPRFGNLYLYKPSALQKKPSASSEETFRFAEAFRFAAHNSFTAHTIQSRMHLPQGS